ncbi:hypothetical protein PILCRDRAFT_720891 [Piloderma croceum F 1598]|uniref:Uncharacterized protein n=1 Tax=Piloderma croceum (strain F 1598) TaxID=765440 RepID=A0A0C3F0V6_PILCF|nr:hypothetical protein PILCRDRAFT_720891 [Piloderma croceum F 1598]
MHRLIFEGIADLDILRRASSAAAVYNSSEREKAPKCLPGTREDVLAILSPQRRSPSSLLVEGLGRFWQISYGAEHGRSLCCSGDASCRLLFQKTR